MGVQPGTRARWREVCISELRVLGQAPGQREGERFPRVAVGALPGAPPAAPTDRAAVRQAVHDMTLRFTREWGALNRLQGERSRACALTDEEDASAVDLWRRRERFLQQMLELVEPIDAEVAERIRAARYSRANRRSTWIVFVDGDQDVVAAGFEAVLGWLSDSRASCRFHRADASQRLLRAVDQLRADRHACGHLDMDYPNGDAPADLRRDCRVAERVEPTLTSFDDTAESLRALAPRIRRLVLPEGLSPALLEEWRLLQVSLESARQSCGWP